MNEKLKAEILKEAQKHPFCQHCQINPAATEPYDKRVKIPIDDLTDRLLEKVHAETGASKECVMCVSFMRFMKLSSEGKEMLLKAEYEWRKKQGVIA
jgi:hypothetical protein